MRAGEDGRSIALTTGESQRAMLPSLWRMDELMKGRTGKSRFTVLDVTTACASLCLRGVLPGVPGGQRGPGGLSSATQPKESSTRANSKLNPLSAYPFCRHEPGRRIPILPPRAASQPSPTCVSSISTRFTVRGIIILGSKSGYAVSPSPSSLVFPVQLTDLTPTHIL